MQKIQAAEDLEMPNRILEWLSTENISKAKGKTRAEIFEMFGNELMPIAYINPEYLPYLDKDIVDNRVYSGMGYFIDHAVNHHPEVKISDYANIQDIISTPDGVFLDNSKTNYSLVFVKKYERLGTVIVTVNNEKGKIVMHKSFFNQRKNSYAKYKDIRVETSLVGGHSTISPVDKSTAASALSGRNDNAKVLQKFNFTK